MTGRYWIFSEELILLQTNDYFKAKLLAQEGFAAIDTRPHFPIAPCCTLQDLLLEIN